MKRFAIVVGLAVSMSAGAFGAAHAATVQSYQQGAFEEAQKTGEPALIFVEASWCPTCAKERPILQRLSETPEFTNLNRVARDLGEGEA